MPNRKKTDEAFAAILTKNAEMRSIFRYIESIAGTNMPVLITGETGVGKELIAGSIHAMSKVSGKMVTVNVAGLDDNIFSDTLFGHLKGAFTGADNPRPGLLERASGGTIFLDEIGDMSPVSQLKLLRLVENGEYLPLGMDKPKMSDARIITATNEDLWTLQRAGKFRKDLNFRLRTHHIHVPPLRERKNDLPILVDHFLAKTASALGIDKPVIQKELITLLREYNFPGNIRELQSMLFDALSRDRSGSLNPELFQNHMVKTDKSMEDCKDKKPRETTHQSPLGNMKELPTIKEITQMLIAEAMRRTKGNQSMAAKMLGISQPALSKRLKKENLQWHL